mgnify:CR=1 FL=1
MAESRREAELAKERELERKEQEMIALAMRESEMYANLYKLASFDEDEDHHHHSSTPPAYSSSTAHTNTSSRRSSGFSTSVGDFGHSGVWNTVESSPGHSATIDGFGGYGISPTSNTNLWDATNSASVVAAPGSYITTTSSNGIGAATFDDEEDLVDELMADLGL